MGYDGRGRDFPLEVVKGDDLALTVTAVDANGAAISLATATIQADVLDRVTGAVVVTMTDAVSGAGSNVITLSLTDTQTGALTVAQYRWTLEVTRGSDTRQWMAGDFVVHPVGASVRDTGSAAGTVTVTSGAVTLYVAATGAAGVGSGDLLAANNLSDVASAATSRTNLGLAIGTNVQAYDADLADIAGIADVQGDIIVRGAAGWERLAKSATATDVLTAGASQPAWAAPSGGGATNLTWTAATSTVASDTGTDAVLTAVDGTNPGLMTSAMKTKLDGIETAADVTDAANVAAAGAHMAGGTDVPVTDGGTGASTAADARTNLGLVIGTNVQAQDAELAALAGLTSAADKAPYFTGSGTAALADLTTFGRSLIDDANAAAARTTLGVDAAGTDNSTPVTLAGTPDYITIAGQVITRGLIDLATDVTGDLPVAEGGTGASTAADARTNLGLAIGTNVQAYDADLADIAGIADVQGDIIVRGAAGWERLAKSATSTHVLTAGASQPSWAAPVGGSSDPLDGNAIIAQRIFVGRG